jgi:hypothetical protein
LIRSEKKVEYDRTRRGGGDMKVVVYVRKADDNQRSMSFDREVDGLPTEDEMIDMGWALDGNQVLICVPASKLNEAQRDLRSVLQEEGHEVSWQ